jgi:hypothetical protein
MDGGARFERHHGDCRDVLRQMPDCSVDSIVGESRQIDMFAAS